MLEIAADLNPNPELDELVDFWCGVFEVPAEVFTNVWGCTPADRRRTFWRREAGELAATVQVYLLPLQGEVVGCVANVATRADSRGKGLSSELLQESIDWMEAEGIRRSYLFTARFAHYAKLGWEKTGNSIAMITSEAAPVEPGDVPDIEWMAELYAASAALRPFAMQRDAAWWRAVVQPRLEGNLIWSNDRAYLIGDRSDRLRVNEAAGDPEAIDELLLGAAAWADGQASYFGPTSLGTRAQWMGGMMRGGGWSDEAWFSPLDCF